MTEAISGVLSGAKYLQSLRYFAGYLMLAFYASSSYSSSASSSSSSHMSDTIVETQYGRLRGVLIGFQRKDLCSVEAYFGLQYASVLGGELRFMPPTSSLEKWDGIRVAVQHRPVCPQRIPSDEELRRRMPLGKVAHLKRIIAFLDKQSEECLNLNVYVPVRGILELKSLILYTNKQLLYTVLQPMRYINPRGFYLPTYLLPRS